MLISGPLSSSIEIAERYAGYGVHALRNERVIYSSRAIGVTFMKLGVAQQGRDGRLVVVSVI